MDGILSQSDKFYLADLLAYQRILDQRNAALKNFFENRSFDRSLLDGYNAQLAARATRLYAARRKFIASFQPVFDKYYALISSGHEQVNLNYVSDLDERDPGNQCVILIEYW